MIIEDLIKKLPTDRQAKYQEILNAKKEALLDEKSTNNKLRELLKELKDSNIHLSEDLKKEIKKLMPKEVKFPEVQKVEIQNQEKFPEKIKAEVINLYEPKDYLRSVGYIEEIKKIKQFDELTETLEALKSGINSLETTLKRDILNVRVKNQQPAQASYSLTGGGGVIPFRNINNDTRKPIVDANDRLEIAGVSGYPMDVNIVGLSGYRADVNQHNQLKVVLDGMISAENSVMGTSLLSPDEEWVGVGATILDYGYIYVSMYSDVAGASGGLVIEQSTNGASWYLDDVYTVPAGKAKTFAIQPAMQNMRVRYKNGGATQGAFVLQTIFKKTAAKPSSHRIQDNIIDDDDGELQLSVLKLRTAQDTYVSGTATNSGNFKVSLEEYDPVFLGNPFPVAPITPIIGQWGTGVSQNTPIKIDPTTSSLQVVDYEHHEIHEGDHYNICGYQTLGNAGVVDFRVTTPITTEWSHMIFSVEGSQALSIVIYEGASLHNPGATIIPQNNNRNVGNSSILIIDTGASIAAVGNTIFAQYSGANRFAGVVERARELILKQNSTYIFRVTNQTATDNIISYCSEWYEHTPNN